MGALPNLRASPGVVLGSPAPDAAPMRSPLLCLVALLAACCAPQPAAEPSTPPGPSGAPVPSSPPPIAPAQLSPQGREAWHLLAGTARFTDAAIYDGGATPKEVLALRILWREPAADTAFDALLEQGTLGARLYALCGLYYTDPQAFARGLASLRGTDARIRFQTGCEILEDYPVAELLQLERGDVVRLDSRDQTIRAWKALDQRRLPFAYDIAGGGYPDLFRTGGGYGELREQALAEGVD